MEKSWNVFIKTAGKWMVFDLFMANVIMTMASLYFVNVFSKSFTIETLALNRILQSSACFLISSLIVYKAIDHIKPHYILVTAAISYPILFLFMVSNETYLLTNAMVGSVFCTITQVVQSRIRAENVIHEHRVKWNNLCGLVSQAGIIVGSGISSLSLLSKVPFWAAYLIIYILFDIGTITMIILIKKKIIKY